MSRKHFATVKVIKNGRITIPSDIRELEDIKEGSFVRISVEKIDEAGEEKKQKNISAKANHKKQIA